MEPCRDRPAPQPPLTQLREGDNQATNTANKENENGNERFDDNRPESRDQDDDEDDDHSEEGADDKADMAYEDDDDDDDDDDNDKHDNNGNDDDDDDDEAHDTFEQATQLSRLSISREDGNFWILAKSQAKITFMSLEKAKPFFARTTSECGLILNCCAATTRVPATTTACIALQLSEQYTIEDLKQQLAAICSRVTEAMQTPQERIVVCCEDGLMKSPTMALLVLMLCEGVTFMEAYKWIMTVNRTQDITVSITPRASQNLIASLSSV